MLRLDFDEFNIAAPFTCGGSGSSVQCGTADGPLIGDCIYDSMTVTTPGTLLWFKLRFNLLHQTDWRQRTQRTQNDMGFCETIGISCLTESHRRSSGSCVLSVIIYVIVQTCKP